MEDHRARVHLGEPVGDVEAVDGGERGGGPLGARGLALELDELLALRRGGAGDEDVGEGARAEAPVLAHQADDRLAGALVGDLRPRRVAPVDGEQPHPLRVGGCVGDADRGAGGAREEVHRATARGLDHGGERRHFVVEISARRWAIGGETGARRVVADHGPVAAKRLDVGAEARVAPVQLQVAHPEAGEDQRRAGSAARPGDPAPSRGGEADRLLFHALSVTEMARTGQQFGPIRGSGSDRAPLE